jgi:predicted permease
MSQLLADAAHSVRRYLRTPTFTVVAVMTLALGIGANTAIFSLIRSVLLQPLPYDDAGRVVMLWNTAAKKGDQTWLSALEVKGYAEESRVFEEVAGYIDGAANITGSQEPERVGTAAVTPNLFRALGVQPAHGRPFFREDAIASPTTVIISDALWQRRFSRGTGVIGQALMVNGIGRTIVGILPAEIRLPDEFRVEHPADLWLPQPVDVPGLAGWGNRSFTALARLKPGVTIAMATAELHAAERRWFEGGAFPNAVEPPSRMALPVRDFVLDDARGAMLILTGAVGFILLIACANVANLMLARSDDRAREVSIRRALGASRARILRLLLTESVVLAVAGGVIGSFIAWGGTRALVAAYPASVPRAGDVGVDGTVFGFALLLALGTGILFGLAPAIELSRPDLQASIRAGGRAGTIGRGQQRFRDALAVTQVAFCVVLLIGATLLVRSFANLQQVDLGFDKRSALTFRIVLPGDPYDSPRAIGFYRQALRQLEQLPGVRSVGATRLLPLTGTIGDWSISIEGRPAARGENPNGDWQVVTPGYMESMGMHLAQGRFIASADDERSAPVAVVNEAMATRYWPEGAIGKRFRIGTDSTRPWITIVGVARAVHHNAVVEAPREEMYVPHAQWAAAGASTPRGMTFVMRTSADPLAMVSHVRQVVKAMDPTIPIADVRTLEMVTDRALAQPRFATTLLGLFGAVALLLATIGIYGVVALRVARRGREFGIRMALGAQANSVVGMVLSRGVTIAGIGVAVGTVGALAATRSLGSFLYGVGSLDPLTFAAVPLFLALVALAASAIPAMRATRIDPAVALREE